MPVKSFFSFAGFVMLIAGIYAPLLHVSLIGNFSLSQVNMPYGIAIMLVAIVGIAGIVLRQRKLIRVCAWISLLLVVLLLIGTFLKVHTSFSFIPFKSVSAYLAKHLIKFKWAWYLFFAGAILAIVGIGTTKRSAMVTDNNNNSDRG